MKVPESKAHSIHSLYRMPNVLRVDSSFGVFSRVISTIFTQDVHASQWLSEEYVVADDETVPFVLNYEIENESETRVRFRFFVTCKVLMKSAIGAQKIHCDATHKIVWEDYPLLILGTTDLHREFHV